MKSVSRNYIYNTAYNILNIIIPLATAPYLARILGTEGVGIYAYYFAIAQYFTLFAKLGLTNYGTRHLAIVRDNEKKLITEFSTLYTMQITVSMIVSLLYICFVLLFAKEKVLASIFVVWVISVAFDIDWFLFAIEDFKSAAIRNCLVKGIAAFTIFIIVRSKDDIWKYAVITSFSYALGYIYLWIKCKKFISLKYIDKKKVLSHIKPCMVLMIPVIALSIYRSMDKVMLGILSNMEQTGLYEYAEKIVYCLTAFISSFGQVMMPRMTNLAAKNDRKTSVSYIHNSMSFIMFLSVGMCFGLMSISDSLVPILYGKGFHGSIILMKLLSITLIFIAWGNVIRSQYVIPNKKDKIYICSISIGALCNLLINAVMIPFYGAIGACIGTIIAELSVPIFQAIVLRKELQYKKMFIKAIPFLIFGIGMYLICEFLQHYTGIGLKTMITQVFVGGVVYSGLSLIYMKKGLKIIKT